jgi:pre-mRNA-processing factor 8
MNGMEGDFFGQLSAEEIQKKARKWRNSQKKRFNEKRRRGGGAGVDMGKSVSAAFWY